LLCLVILTSSSLVCVYRNSFGTLGDWKIIFTVNLWLSRHLIFRILCTGITCTSSSQFFLQSSSHTWFRWNIGQSIAKYCSSGQYFDAPSRSAILAISSSGGDHYNNHSSNHFTLNSSFANSIPHNYIILPALKFYYWMLSMKQASKKNGGLLATFLNNFKNEKKSKRRNKGDTSQDGNSQMNSPARRGRPKNSHSNSNHRISQNHNLQKILSSKVYKQLEQLWEQLPPSQLSFAIISGIICIVAIILFNPNTYNLNISAQPSTHGSFFSSHPMSSSSSHPYHQRTNHYHRNMNTNNHCSGNSGGNDY